MPSDPGSTTQVANTTPQVANEIRFSDACRMKIIDYLDSHESNSSMLPEKLNEAIVALSQCMNTEGLNPRQADRIARRRAQKILQSLLASQRVAAPG